MADMDKNAKSEHKLYMCDDCKDALGDVDHGLGIGVDLENESLVFGDVSYRREEDDFTVHQHMTVEEAEQLGCENPDDIMRAFHGDSGSGGSASVGSTAAFRNNYDDIFSDN